MRLGSNTFTLRSGNSMMRGGRHGEASENYLPISYEEAMQFVADYETKAIVSVSAFGAGAKSVKYESNKTNPNVPVMGVDEHYLNLSSYVLESGRNFSPSDVTSGENVVILGADVVKTLFSDIINPVDKQVQLDGKNYLVIGTLMPKGNTFGFASDNQFLIPVSTVRKNFETSSTDYSINVMLPSAELMPDAVSEAKGLMRIVRSDDIASEPSFDVRMSDSVVSELTDLISGITMGGILISIITLFGASIGLMNIMLVSVTERTREIGTRKALGASAKTVRRQFLVESIVIGQIGGLVGIAMGIMMGNGVAYLLETSFDMPWAWLGIGVTICFIVSVVSGYYPARKAANLDPIEALRYE